MLLRGLIQGGMKIWCNAQWTFKGRELLEAGVLELGEDRLIYAQSTAASNLVAGVADPAMAEAEVVFGQPDPGGVMAAPTIKWVQLTSAGYTRYDQEAFRDGFGGRGGRLTTSSMVYADPCAEQALAFMLSASRELPQSLDNQRSEKGWPAQARRAGSRLLRGQTVLLLGFGAIGRRLAELLAPFDVRLLAFRRQAVGVGGVEMVGMEGLAAALGQADHVVNLLPETDATRGFMGVQQFAQMKPSTYFYNVGRGRTVDQNALRSALESGQLGAAYLDVTEPEPLPEADSLWTTPRCWITPHTAGGHSDEESRQIRHFLENLKRWKSGQPLLDQVI
jgi:phosphoglycerate dehydrogenase-like enzyme